MTISLTELNHLPRPDFVARLAEVFEDSPWVAERAADARPFSAAGVMHDVMVAVVRAASAEEQLALIRAHPDLAGKMARAGGLTTASTGEQKGAGLDRLDDAEYERFDRLNRAYREKFGFPFVIAVRGLTAADILAAFERRLPNDPATERAAALDEIARIARIRLERILGEA
ncbi:MAG TPA: 2-oxo-4-hydroxy-4-carboxy-5-ureidoimidazoline decarboxylase [Alphaproteobacteria bacterium]|nr:2-oxo-4-hydroxy-4-carboxy-5-ureidoimidazoline decarboxylase [Alphaproteobacteria bacterium]